MLSLNQLLSIFRGNCTLLRCSASHLLCVWQQRLSRCWFVANTWWKKWTLLLEQPPSVKLMALSWQRKLKWAVFSVIIATLSCFQKQASQTPQKCSAFVLWQLYKVSFQQGHANVWREVDTHVSFMDAFGKSSFIFLIVHKTYKKTNNYQTNPAWPDNSAPDHRSIVQKYHKSSSKRLYNIKLKRWYIPLHHSRVKTLRNIWVFHFHENNLRGKHTLEGKHILLPTNTFMKSWTSNVVYKQNLFKSSASCSRSVH